MSRLTTCRAATPDDGNAPSATSACTRTDPALAKAAAEKIEQSPLGKALRLTRWRQTPSR